MSSARRAVRKRRRKADGLPFYLDIRHAVESADELSPGVEALYYDQRLVRVGSDAGCECHIPDGELRDVHFLVLSESEGEHHVLCPGNGAELFLNRDLLTSETELRSGDEIRAAHWVFRFVRVYARSQKARRSDGLAVAAKGLVAAILFFEIGVVAWLPRQLRSAALWGEEIARQRTTYLVDTLRIRNDTADPRDELEKAAREVVRSELDSLARYVREHEEALTREQWAKVAQDLRAYEEVMSRLGDGTAFRPVPPVDIDGAVRAALGGDGRSMEKHDGN